MPKSIDRDIAWTQSRYDKAGPGGDGADYINCPMDEEQYNRLRRCAAGGASSTSSRSGRRSPYFDGCLPIEVMARARRARRCATGR